VVLNRDAPLQHIFRNGWHLDRAVRALGCLGGYWPMVRRLVPGPFFFSWRPGVAGVGEDGSGSRISCARRSKGSGRGGKAAEPHMHSGKKRKTEFH
jgi:hypothetical protein